MKKMKKIGVTLLLIAIVLQTGFMNIVAEVKPQAEERIMYLDYTYAGGDSDGSLDKPFNAMGKALNEIGTREGYTKTLGKVEAGSTYVTLYKEFLQTLPDGNYILEVDFEDATTKGYASATFRLKEGAPSTGDTTNTAYMFMLMMGSMMVAGYLCRKRKGTKQEA